MKLSRLSAVLFCAALCASAGGCAWPTHAPSADSTPSPADRRRAAENDAAVQLQRLTQIGDFAAAHRLADEQAAGDADRPARALWWRCQHLYVYGYEERPADAKTLAATLAQAPAARQPEFLLSTGFAVLFHALARSRQPEAAAELLNLRYRALLAMDEHDRWWNRRMAEVVSFARAIGDDDLARAASAQVDLPPSDPYRGLIDPPRAAPPIQPE
ncbi:MAG: hypothetical protein BIFFINMI_00731 [Phycisphaerae bacterium]|nr:hypothetical protein [Phycisphaerae bacterium]